MNQINNPYQGTLTLSTTMPVKTAFRGLRTLFWICSKSKNAQLCPQACNSPTGTSPRGQCPHWLFMIELILLLFEKIFKLKFGLKPGGVLYPSRNGLKPHSYSWKWTYSGLGNLKHLSIEKHWWLMSVSTDIGVKTTACILLWMMNLAHSTTMPVKTTCKDLRDLF